MKARIRILCCTSVVCALCLVVFCFAHRTNSESPAPTQANDASVKHIVGEMAETEPAAEIPPDPFDYDEKELKAGEEGVLTVNGTDFIFVWCPPGSFTMGNPRFREGDSPAEKPHVVTLSGFWIGRTEVTQGQWKAITGKNPVDELALKYEDINTLFWGEDFPAWGVSKDESLDLCSDMTKATDKVITLPTEAQWEYANRAGRSGGICYDSSDEKIYIDKNWTESARICGIHFSCETEEGAGRESNGKFFPKHTSEMNPNPWGIYGMIKIGGGSGEHCSDEWSATGTTVLPKNDPECIAIFSEKKANGKVKLYSIGRSGMTVHGRKKVEYSAKGTRYSLRNSSTGGDSPPFEGSLVLGHTCRLVLNPLEGEQKLRLLSPHVRKKPVRNAADAGKAQPPGHVVQSSQPQQPLSALPAVPMDPVQFEIQMRMMQNQIEFNNAMGNAIMQLGNSSFMPSPVPSPMPAPVPRQVMGRCSLHHTTYPLPGRCPQCSAPKFGFETILDEITR